MTTKSIEEIVKEFGELRLTVVTSPTEINGDVVIDLTATRKMEDDFLRSSLTSLRNATIEECKEVLGRYDEIMSYSFGGESHRTLLEVIKEKLTALKSKEEKI